MHIEFVTEAGEVIMTTNTAAFPSPLVGDILSMPGDKMYRVMQRAFVGYIRQDPKLVAMPPKSIHEVGQPQVLEVKMQCVVKALSEEA